MTRPTFMSLFSGVGGFDIGLERAGWQCVAQCDNDPFCNKVLAKHWPGVKRYDDVRAIGLLGNEGGRVIRDRTDTQGGEWRQRGAGRGDIALICGGFPCQDLSVAGKRAGLDGARSGLWFEFHRILSELRPTFCLIENVPGLLSSNGGADFAVILWGLEQLGYAVGWAVLDSQHFGVPQRRRRVYIIGGPSRASVQQILSLCESGDWNTQARRAEREDTPGPLASRTGGFRQDLDNDSYVQDVAYALAARNSKGVSTLEGQNNLVTHSLRADGFDAGEDGTGRGTPLVWEQRYVRNGRGAPSEVAPPLKARSGEDGRGDSAPMVGVRRLTPVEAERLQAFPDGWTCICDQQPCRCPDGPRYKALGNAVTTSVITYLGHRIREVLA